LANLDQVAMKSKRAIPVSLSIPVKDGPHRWMCCRFPVRSRLAHTYIGGWMAEAGGCVSENQENKPAGQNDSRVIGVIRGESDRVADANDTFLEMLGYTRDDLAAGALTWESISPADSRDTWEDMRREVAAAGVCRPREKQLLRKDGRKLPVIIAGAVEGGDRPGCGFYVLDIGEQKRHERRLHRDEAWQSLGRIAAGIAHDFNNLLVVIMGNASLAASDPALPPKTRTYLSEVISAAEQGAELVRRMLVYSGKARIQAAPVQVRDVIENVRRAEPAPNGVDVEVAIPGDLPPVPADAALITEALRSLWVNAIEAAAPAGTVRVRAGVRQLARNLLVADAELPTGEYVFVTVEDTGPGMDENVQERIFDPFFTTKFAGRGLGLAAAYGIVRRHGGAISVQSAKGQGSRFEVLLPRSRT
jgi:PAS domain S-box-containing protein